MYSGEQSAIMHGLGRDGIRAAASHAGAIVLGRAAHRFDLLAVTVSKAVTRHRSALALDTSNSSSSNTAEEASPATDSEQISAGMHNKFVASPHLSLSLLTS